MPAKGDTKSLAGSNAKARKVKLMAPVPSKAQAQAYRKRWQLVSAREAEELRSTNLATRWRQFNTLLRWAQEFGWADAFAEGEADVRERWARLRKDRRA